VFRNPPLPKPPALQDSIRFFKSLLHQIIQFYEQELTPPLWNNFRLVAADGTTLALPNSREINSHYGISGDRKMSLANIFTCYDA